MRTNVRRTLLCLVWSGYDGIAPISGDNCSPTGTQGIGTGLGPIIGGAFTSSPADWRWAFYINLCVAAVCSPVYLFMIPSIDPRRGTSIIGRFIEIDTVRTALLVGVSLSKLMAISFGGLVHF